MKRFIILSTARTGSNYLMNLLSGHDHIKMTGEIFNLDKLSQEDIDSALGTPIDYFNRKLGCDPGSGTRATGAKVFYEHLTQDYFTKFIRIDDASPQLKNRVKKLEDYISAHYDRAVLEVKFKQAWDYLAGDESLNVIHLKRRNLLETLFSLKRAYVTQEWMSVGSHTQSPELRLKLDYSECLSYFIKITAYEEKYDRLFSAHNKLEVVYEELAAHKDKVIREITDFLSVDPFAASSIMKKQANVCLSEVLVNYHDLKEKFEHTVWSRFFEEAYAA